MVMKSPVRKSWIRDETVVLKRLSEAKEGEGCLVGREEVAGEDKNDDVREAESYVLREEGDLRISKEKARRWNALTGRRHLVRIIGVGELLKTAGENIPSRKWMEGDSVRMTYFGSF